MYTSRWKPLNYFYYCTAVIYCIDVSCDQLLVAQPWFHFAKIFKKRRMGRVDVTKKVKKLRWRAELCGGNYGNSGNAA